MSVLQRIKEIKLKDVINLVIVEFQISMRLDKFPCNGKYDLTHILPIISDRILDQITFYGSQEQREKSKHEIFQCIMETLKSIFKNMKVFEVSDSSQNQETTLLHPSNLPDTMAIHLIIAALCDLPGDDGALDMIASEFIEFISASTTDTKDREQCLSLVFRAKGCFLFWVQKKQFRELLKNERSLHTIFVNAPAKSIYLCTEDARKMLTEKVPIEIASLCLYLMNQSVHFKPEKAMDILKGTIYIGLYTFILLEKMFTGTTTGDFSKKKKQSFRRNLATLDLRCLVFPLNMKPYEFCLFVKGIIHKESLLPKEAKLDIAEGLQGSRYWCLIIYLRSSTVEALYTSKDICKILNDLENLHLPKAVLTYLQEYNEGLEERKLRDIRPALRYIPEVKMSDEQYSAFTLQVIEIITRRIYSRLETFSLIKLSDIRQIIASMALNQGKAFPSSPILCFAYLAIQTVIRLKDEKAHFEDMRNLIAYILSKERKELLEAVDVFLKFKGSFEFLLSHSEKLPLLKPFLLSIPKDFFSSMEIMGKDLQQLLPVPSSSTKLLIHMTATNLNLDLMEVLAAMETQQPHLGVWWMLQHLISLLLTQSKSRVGRVKQILSILTSKIQLHRYRQKWSLPPQYISRLRVMAEKFASLDTVLSCYVSNWKALAIEKTGKISTPISSSSATKPLGNDGTQKRQKENLISSIQDQPFKPVLRSVITPDCSSPPAKVPIIEDDNNVQKNKRILLKEPSYRKCDFDGCSCKVSKEAHFICSLCDNRVDSCKMHWSLVCGQKVIATCPICQKLGLVKGYFTKDKTQGVVITRELVPASRGEQARIIAPIETMFPSTVTSTEESDMERDNSDASLSSESKVPGGETGVCTDTAVPETSIWHRNAPPSARRLRKLFGRAKSTSSLSIRSPSSSLSFRSTNSNVRKRQTCSSEYDTKSYSSPAPNSTIDSSSTKIGKKNNNTSQTEKNSLALELEEAFYSDGAPP